ncbi:uncharacterized protein LOC119745631 [Patiria miniata]|uniref:HTH OST-type domain-containing protein n=1 Tax=Patiria miniata TaxID=46514 RepID=A0A914BPJ8_PATMI|nr:uncharacterized protein LOC119745631 [Patiria miniata]
MSSIMSTEDLTTEVKKHTRGVLLSKIGGVPLVQFEKDYRELLGKRFPFRELGFSDVRSCLESLADTVRFEYSEALQELMLFGIADDHSFMSSPAIKAQFTPDKPITKRKRTNNKKYPKKHSDSDDSKSKHAAHKSKAFQRREKQSQPVNGQGSSTNTQASSLVELRPNLKGLYSVCVTRLPQELERDVQELFSEVASPAELSRGGMHFFLRYKSHEEAENIIARYDEYKLKGTTLKVQPAKEKMAPREGAHNHSSKVRESRPKESQQLESPQLDECDNNKVNTNGREGKNSSRKPHRNAEASGKADRPRSAPRNKNSRKCTRAGGDVKQESQSDDVSSQSPWQQSQPNGDAFGMHKGETDASLENMLQQFESLAAGHSTEPASLSERTDPVSDRSIPKPRLRSILDLADRFKGNKDVK